MATGRMRTLVTGGGFFEGPRWHDGSWWVSDFHRRTVSRISTDGREQIVVEVAAQPSGLGWLPDGSLVVASMQDRRVLRFADGQLRTLADLTAFCGGPINDLVVDAGGHVFVGEFGSDLGSGAAFAPASLKRVDPDGRISVVADDLYFPNGSVVTSDGSTLIVGETFGNRYTAFDLACDGTVSNRRTWAAFGPLPVGSNVSELFGQLRVAPDGCALDADGHIWAADAVGRRVVRVAAGGSITDVISAPAGLGVFACALGGDRGTTLLLCCAPDFDQSRRASVREAELVVTEVEVPGSAHRGRRAGLGTPRSRCRARHTEVEVPD